MKIKPNPARIQFTEEQRDTIETALLEMLPHGSGIDCKWVFNWNAANNTVSCSNSYHCMNEHGFYDGYADFTIKIRPLLALTAFRFCFNGKTAQYKNKRYQLRDYLEDTIYHALDGKSSLYQISLKK